MKKIISVYLLTLTFVLFVCVCAKASAQRLVDNAGLLDDVEAQELLSELDSVSEKHSADVVVMTSYGTEFGMSTRDYCEYVFENNYGFSDDLDGVILYVNMAEREWQIATSGKVITALTDYGLEYIEDKFLDYLSDGYYYEAFTAFVLTVDELITIAENGEPFDVNTSREYGNMFDRLSIGACIRISVIFGIIVAAISVGAMAAQLKSVSMQSGANAYIGRDAFRLNQSRDIYLYRNVRRTPRPQQTSSSGGGSTVHRSSSGHSFGGRGGKF